MKNIVTHIAVDTIITAGLGCLIYGAALVSPALAWSAGGAALIWFGFGMSQLAKKQQHEGQR